MDASSVQLLDELAASQAKKLLAALPAETPPRGGTLFPLVRQVVESVDAERIDLVNELEAAKDAARDALGRKLLRCTYKLDTVHWLVAEYSADAGRQDIPVGLLALVDALVEEMLPSGMDPLVHLDWRRMYSTLPLTKVAADLVGETDRIQSGPIVLNLPAVDPANALYSPILAHEVGHILVDQDELSRAVLAKTDLPALNRLLVENLAKDASAEPAQWKATLNSWIRELLCDALAVALTGPSFLYASAAFLPAPAPGSVGVHPFPIDRVRLTLEQLDDLGWADYLHRTVPVLRSWLESLAARTPAPVTPDEEFLRGALALVASPVAEVARSCIRKPIRPAEYAAIAQDCCALVERGIPPAAVGDTAPGPWHVVLAGWEVAIAAHGDTARSLGAAVADAEFNAFLVKSLELARVTELWRGM